MDKIRKLPSQDLNIIIDPTPGQASYLTVGLRKEDLRLSTDLEEAKEKFKINFTPSCKGCGHKIRVNIFLDHTIQRSIIRDIAFSLKPQKPNDSLLSPIQVKGLVDSSFKPKTIVKSEIQQLVNFTNQFNYQHEEPDTVEPNAQKQNPIQRKKPEPGPFKIVNVIHSLPDWEEPLKTHEPSTEEIEVKIEPEDYSAFDNCDSGAYGSIDTFTDSNTSTTVVQDSESQNHTKRPRIQELPVNVELEINPLTDSTFRLEEIPIEDLTSTPETPVVLKDPSQESFRIEPLPEISDALQPYQDSIEVRDSTLNSRSPTPEKKYPNYIKNGQIFIPPTKIVRSRCKISITRHRDFEELFKKKWRQTLQIQLPYYEIMQLPNECKLYFMKLRDDERSFYMSCFDMRPLVCDICQYKASNFSILIRHRKKHFIDQNNPIQCRACWQDFPETEMFARHVLVCSSKFHLLKNHCKYCEEQFTTIDALKSHEAGHFHDQQRDACLHLIQRTPKSQKKTS